MEILRVFNNNVVLTRRPDGTDVVLTGRGVGFQAKPGQRVDESKVVRTFVPADGRDPDHMGEQIASIAPERVQQVEAALASAGVGGLAAQSPWLVIALADHLGFAVERSQRGIALEYPLEAEVSQLYPQEFAQAGAVLGELRRVVEAPLPDGEGVAITLHLVNAGFSSGDLSRTYTMTGLIQQLLEVIGETYGMQLETSTLAVARFITHLRYLFVRISTRRQLEGEVSRIGRAIQETYPAAHRCAARVASLLELRLEVRITDDEIAYLALHISRLTADPRAQGGELTD